MKTAQYEYLDPLYGDCVFSRELEPLIRAPIVQRLRNIRLSNIDSLSMPGVANVSRFEHTLGTAYLASQVDAIGIDPKEKLVLVAAALLHDSAMPPFGHLGEEALAYLGYGAVHEQRWMRILEDPDDAPTDGIQCQIYLGRTTKLQEWAEHVFHSEWKARLRATLGAIRGAGAIGNAIAGDIDLDNMDNVVRAAFHMGLQVDKTLPLKLTRAIVDLTEEGIVFREDGFALISAWLDLRAEVYRRFMRSRIDFAGKIMLLSATLETQRAGSLTDVHWQMTEWEYLSDLIKSPIDIVRETTERWLLSEPWALSKLFWMEDEKPNYKDMLVFSESLTDRLGRPCLAYCIPDKTHRVVRVVSETGQVIEFGSPPTRSLFGVGSKTRKEFTIQENEAVKEEATAFFQKSCTEMSAFDDASTSESALSLF